MTDKIFSFDNPNQTTYPLPSLISDPTAVLRLADPVVYNLATFFTQLLNTNLLPRFVDEAQACGVTHSQIDSWIDGYAVAQTVVFPLSENLLKVTDFKFPLLAIQPEEEFFENFTLTNVSTTRTFRVAWILPPLTARQYNRLYPFLGLIAKTWLAYGSQGYDPKVSNTSFWQQAGLIFGKFYGADYTPYQGLGKNDEMVRFPTLEMHLSFTERNQQPVPQNYPDNFTSSELQLNYVDGYSPANPIIDFIDGYITPNISIASCSPNSVTIQGNTLLVIKGTGFDPSKIQSPNQITICGSTVKQVVVKSPNLLMCVTNPGIDGTSGIPGDIVITDLQGNTYRLVNGFTYN